MSLKPMLKYRGGKTRELPMLLPFVPAEYDTYIEPFFGGGALYFHLQPHRAIINDLNKPLMRFYADIRNDFYTVLKDLEKLHAEYEANRQNFDVLKAAHPHTRVPDANETVYYTIRNMFNGLEPPLYSWGAIYYYINKTAYSGMIRYNSKGHYNVPYGRYKHLNISGVTDAHSRLLQNALLMTGDYDQAFQRCRADDFIFLDPPYDCIFSDYGNSELGDGFSEEEHIRLADAFYSLPCKALMVIGKTELTQSLYGSSTVYEYDKSYAVNIRNRFKSASRHLVVKNAPWE